MPAHKRTALIGVDYGRFLRLCGYHETQGERGKLNESVTRFLNQSFSQITEEFRVTLTEAQKELKSKPLRDFREPSHLQATWQLARIPSFLQNYDFLSCVDPEKTGILCGKNHEDAALLTKEKIDGLGLFGDNIKLGESVFGLRRFLDWWRRAICCVWAGIIFNDLICYFDKRKLILPAPGCETDTLRDVFARNETPNLIKPIGEMLAFEHISDERADEFYQLYDRARFGSKSCGDCAAAAFKGWLRSLNVGILQERGLCFEEAHLLLLAGSQRSPEMDVGLSWDKRYKFVCHVKNKDVHGYPDEKATSEIPEQILFEFFNDAEPKVQEDLIRLLIRGGWGKARDLVFNSLEKESDY